MEKINLRFSVVVLMIIAASVCRFVPHPAGFAPIGAMALFGAAYFKNKFAAFVIPVVTMWISDLVMNNIIFAGTYDTFVFFYQGFYITYGAFLLIVAMGILTLKTVKIKSVIFSSLGASLIFFIVSNFGVWAATDIYQHNISGLTTCYIAGLPFFRNGIAGDLFFCGIGFGVFEFLKSKVPQLKA